MICWLRHELNIAIIYFIGNFLNSFDVRDKIFVQQTREFDLQCAPSPFLWGVETPSKFSKGEWGVTRTQFLEVVAGKEGEGDDVLQGGCSFYIKNKQKCEIFDDKTCL